MSGGELLAQLGDFTAEFLIASVCGLQSANQGVDKASLPGRHRCGGGSRETTRCTRIGSPALS